MFKYEQVSNLPMNTHRDQCLLGKKRDKKGIKKGLCDTSPNRRKHGGLAPKPPAGTSSLFSTLDREEKEKKKKRGPWPQPPGKRMIINSQETMR